jgi:hypothetical protein
VTEQHWPWQKPNQKPYWTWQNYLLKHWEWSAPPGSKIKRIDIIGFAIALASFGRSGRDIFVSAAKVGELCGYSLTTAKKYRKLVVQLGLFRPTGGHHGRVPDLEIDIPAKAPAKAHVDPWAHLYSTPIVSPTIRHTANGSVTKSRGIDHE